MTEQLILTEKQNAALIVTLNRPDKRNAITIEMMWTLADVFDAAAEDNTVRAVIIQGAGKGFSSGVDFYSLAQFGQQDITPAGFRAFLGKFQAVYTRLENMEKPVICAVHTYCLGMAWELALASDFRIAAEGTTFSMPEVQLGLIPDVGGTSRLTRLVGIARAKELIMTARVIDAQRAYDFGLVNQIAPQGKQLETALQWVAELKGCAPLAVGFAKKIINRGAHLDGLSFLELEAYAQSNLIKTKDVQEGVLARIQKRPPDFKGQ